MSTVFEKTWCVGQPNVAPQDQSSTVQQTRSTLAALFAFLTNLAPIFGAGMSGAGLWVVDCSCDHTTAGTAGDGVNHWGTTWTAINSALTRNTAGNAHSWISLKSPDGKFWFVIDWSTAADNTCNFLLYSSQPTGGTTTAAPVGTELCKSWTNVVLTPVSTATGIHFHGNLATDGSFFFHSSNDAGGGVMRAVEFYVLDPGHGTSDLRNGFMFLKGSQATAIVKADVDNTNANCGARKHDGSASVNWGYSYMCINLNGGVMLASGNLSATDATDGNYVDEPIYAYVDTAGAVSRRGRIQDITWAPESLGEGSYEPVSGPPVARSVVAKRWMPWNGAAAAPSY